MIKTDTDTKKQLNVILVAPRGFCAGVERAVLIVEKALEKYGPPIYVRHEIVHNKYVVETLKKKGAIFVENTSEIPYGARTIFSAHGVSDRVEEEAKERNLPVIDATCPLVTKVHLAAQKHESLGKQIIMIGHKGHAEVEGTTGKVKQDVDVISSKEEVWNLTVKEPDNLAYVTQTTLSVDDTSQIIDELKKRFPKITGPSSQDICYATQNRQNAVRLLANEVDVILVVGAQNSSNSNRLKDLGEELSTPSYLIDSAEKIELSWLENINSVGITAGASAPEVLVQEVVNKLKKFFDISLKELTDKKENIHFKLPLEVRA
ncbi:MAG: 4-hydroxy-3-methylbut-2-enyl diphosphate reductase [Alphaproteobacteria bacterium]|nr:4-hydroxy-3-methylbut-2-enyl diphosphate reductase [Alphaproteobacteria bacterium]